MSDKPYNACKAHVIPGDSPAGRMITEHIRGIFRQHEEQDRFWEERARQKEEKRQRVAAALGGLAGELYAALSGLVENATFSGGSGPAHMSMDREEYRALRARIEELEGRVEAEQQV